MSRSQGNFQSSAAQVFSADYFHQELKQWQSQILFEDYVQHWVAEYRLPNGKRIAGGTKRNLAVDVSHFLPYFAGMRLVDITPLDIKRWYDMPHPEGQWAFHRSCQRLKAIFTAATRMSLDGAPPILQYNPFILPIPPVPQPRSLDVPPVTPVELYDLYRFMPDYTRISVLLAALVGGLRCGEICALQVRDIDLEARRLTVRHSVNRGWDDLGEAQLCEPKTSTSRRTVPIPDRVVPILSKHIAAFCTSKPTCQVLVPKRTNILASTTLGGHFRTARKKAGREDITLHSLRASHATLLMLQGATLREVMSQLGHLSEKVAIQHYQRIVPEHREDMVNLLADSIFDSTLDFGSVK